MVAGNVVALVTVSITVVAACPFPLLVDVEPPSTFTTEYVALFTCSTQTASFWANGSPDAKKKIDDSTKRVELEVLRRMIASICRYIEMGSRTIT